MADDCSGKQLVGARLTQQRVDLVDEDDAGAELGRQAEQRPRVAHAVPKPADVAASNTSTLLSSDLLAEA